MSSLAFFASPIDFRKNDKANQDLQDSMSHTGQLKNMVLIKEEHISQVKFFLVKSLEKKL